MADEIKGSISYRQPTFTFGGNGAVNGGFSFDLPLAAITTASNNAVAYASANTQNAQGFLAGIIGKSQQNVSQASQRSQQFASQNVLAITQMQAQAMNTARYLAQRDGCYITTAICQADGKPDDCDELQTLRRFRDEWLALTDEGQEAIANYYRTAPEIVAAISKMEKAPQIFAMLRDVYLLPAVEAVKAGENGKALCLYQRLVVVASAIAKKRGA